MKRLNLLKNFALFSSLLSSTMCFALSSPDATTAVDAMAEIQTMTVQKTCSSDSDCDSVGLGSKACGGPQSYLVFSKKVTDVKKLTELVSQYNLSVQEENKKLGLISTCSVVPQPQVHCKDKTCQAKAGASFNPYIKSTK